MKSSSAKRELFTPEDNAYRIQPLDCGADSKDFARRLRALGQALERFSFSAFDLELQSGVYRVTGTAISTETMKFSFSRFVRELLRGSPVKGTVISNGGQVDLRFSPDEVEGFDLRGRTRRQDPGKMPDP
ncbi:MAG TPA: hypothetical protein VJQ55_11990, partial [Candidatus Binatia bacterium]|nr:hypothetical protein [Candidatus Binatia bacterium]